MTTKRIAIRIHGVNERRMGWSSLIPVGIISDLDTLSLPRRSTLCSDKLTYIVRNTRDSRLLTAVFRNIKCSDCDAASHLMATVIIPAGYTVAGGGSTILKLLQQLISEYLAKGCTKLPDGGYRFKKDEPTPEELGLSLESLPGVVPLPVQNAHIAGNAAGDTATIRLSLADTVKLLNDNSYQEFTPYRQVEIADDCDTTPSLEGLKLKDVVTPTEYAVIVNGADTGRKLRLADDSFTTELTSDTPLRIYENVTFYLGQVLTSTSGELNLPGGALVKVDREKSKIEVNVPQKPRSDTARLKIFGLPEEAERIKKALLSGELSLQVDGKEMGKALATTEKGVPVAPSEEKHQVAVNKKQTGEIRFYLGTVEFNRPDGKLLSIELRVLPPVKPTNPEPPEPKKAEQPAEYRVIVNGSDSGVRLKSPSDSFTGKPKESQLWLYEEVKFSLKQLLEAPNHSIIFKYGSRAELYETDHKIDITVQPRWQTVNLTIKGTQSEIDKVRHLLSTMKVLLSIGGDDINLRLKKSGATDSIRIFLRESSKVKLSPPIIGNLQLKYQSDTDNSGKEPVTNITITVQTLEREEPVKPTSPKVAEPEPPAIPTRGPWFWRCRKFFSKFANICTFAIVAAFAAIFFHYSEGGPKERPFIMMGLALVASCTLFYPTRRMARTSNPQLNSWGFFPAKSVMGKIASCLLTLINFLWALIFSFMMCVGAVIELGNRHEDYGFESAMYSLLGVCIVFWGIIDLIYSIKYRRKW